MAIDRPDQPPDGITRLPPRDLPHSPDVKYRKDKRKDNRPRKRKPDPNVLAAHSRLYSGPSISQTAGEFTIEVTPEQAEAHPGGHDGATIEASLPVGERPQFRADIVSLLGQGLPKGPGGVAAIAYQQALARRFRLEIEAARKADPDALLSSHGSMKNLQETEKQIRDLILAGDKRRRSQALTTEDPATLLEQEMALAEEWIRANVGELIDSCPACNLPLTIPALPHWAYAKVNGKDGPEYPVWSAEMWKLVLLGALSLHQMAYILRTSIEALRQVADVRGEPWPEDFVGTFIEEEERQLRRLLNADDHEYKQNIIKRMKPKIRSSQ